MESLYALINNELSWLSQNHCINHSNLDSFITDDKKSAEFISSLTDSFKFEMPKEGTTLYKVAQGRARHSAITFLTGLVFKDFENIYNDIDTVLKHKDTAFSLWLMTSLNHDRGYTSTYITNGNLDYSKKFNYLLLKESYDEIPILNQYNIKYPYALAHTYQQIENYDKYARDYHGKSNGIERLDHGILGGIILFDRLIKKVKSLKLTDTNEPLLIKTSALTIAQHNIFKSENKEFDKDYHNKNLDHLMSTSDFIIQKKHSLLLLLCLVDTIECVKKYSKKENEKNSLQTITVLKNIKVNISIHSIIIDYSGLSELEKCKNFNDDICKSILKNIYSLNDWTCFNVQIVEYKATISLKESINKLDATAIA